MKTRIIFGFIAAVPLVALLQWGNVYLMLATTVSLSTLAFCEFDRLFFPARSKGKVASVCLLIAATMMLLQADVVYGTAALWVSFVLIGVAHVFRSNREGDFYKITREMALLVIGYLYVVAVFGFLVPIATLPNGRSYLFLLIFIVFMGDTAAYFAGMFLGKRRLATLLSPKKSIEGSIAAVLSSIVVAWVWLRLQGWSTLTTEYIVKILVFAPVVSALAQIGDLFESMFKRSQMQKDSGSFLPGHGGVLDRVDGLALASPVYFFYLKLFVESAP